MNYDEKYIKYKNKYLTLLNQNGGNGDRIKLMAFTADWCNHCKNFMPVYNSLANNKDNNKIKFINYDSEKNSDKISKYKISGFPTLLIKYNKKLIEYTGKRDENNILDFINKLKT